MQDLQRALHDNNVSLHITVLHVCTSAPSMGAVVLLRPEQNLFCAENGQSVIVKYLTSSKLTLLQLRDAAFRRTLLVQCLVLLHACAHPRQSAIKAATALKERQVSNFLPTHSANIQRTQFGSLDVVALHYSMTEFVSALR